MSKVVDTVAEARNGSSQNATQHYRHMFAIASRVTPSSSLLGKTKEVPVSIHSFETVRGISRYNAVNRHECTAEILGQPYMWVQRTLLQAEK
jgi:hypothetical protein